MRKPVLTAAAVALCFVGSAQSMRPVEKQSERQAPFQDEQNHEVKRFITHKHQQASPENIIFSEDFASGIPATWTNAGQSNGVDNPNAVWEYRGATGAQPVTVGSRGAYANPAATILSPTASNGFVILDSDFLDNAGTAGNFGGGIAPSPHLSTLVSPVIDLSGESNVVLTFNQYYRRFLGPGGTVTPASYVDLSTDGGATWGTTITLNSGVGVNGSTTRDDQQILNVTSVLAGVAQARMRFRFDGDYYFWMVDDIKLTGLEDYDLDFVALDGWSDIDWIVGDGSKMGINTRAQAQDWTFLSSIFNRGSQALNNVQLEVGIIKDNAPYTSLFSPVYASLAAGDTLPYTFLNTLGNQFIPSEAGTYQFYFQINSDSITLNSDTIFTFTTNNLMSLDYNYWYNSLGTANFGGDSSAMAVRIDFEANDTLNAVYVGLGSGTQGGARLIVEVYDSSAFTGFVTGFDKSARLDSAGPYIIDPTNAFQGNITLPLSQSLYLGENNRSVYLVIWMFTNGGASQVAIRNDQTVDATALTSMMHFPGQQWYTGYTNSRSFDSPWIRAITSGGTCNLDQNIYAEAVGNYEVEFSWDGTGATSYNLNLRAVGDTAWTTVLANDTFRVLSNRRPGDYEFYVTEVGGGNPSCVSYFTVECADDIAYSYNVFQAPELGRRGRATVLNTTGGKRKYDIALVNSNGDTTLQQNRRVGFFTNLDDDTYTIYVSDAFGCLADSVGQFTINAMDTAKIPNLINAPNNSPNGFRPTWNSVDGVINYQLRILNVTDGTLVNFITGITDTMRAVTGLTPGKLYRFNVRSRYNNGTANVNSGYSNPVSRNLPAGGNKQDADGASLAEASSLNVYPNPAVDVLHVNAANGSEVALLDINGKLIAQTTSNGQEVSFNLSHLSSGVYMVRISNAHEMTIEKVVKK